MSSEQGPYAVGMRASANEAGRRQMKGQFHVVGEEEAS